MRIDNECLSNIGKVFSNICSLNLVYSFNYSEHISRYWIQKCFYFQFIFRILEEHLLRLRRLDSRPTYCSNHRLVASVEMFIQQFHSTERAWKIWVQHMTFFLVQAEHLFILPGKLTFVNYLQHRRKKVLEHSHGLCTWRSFARIDEVSACKKQRFPASLNVFIETFAFSHWIFFHFLKNSGTISCEYWQSCSKYNYRLFQ